MMASDVIVSDYLSNYIDHQALERSLSVIGASGVVISAFVIKLLRRQRGNS
jgi:hypothetical protein